MTQPLVSAVVLSYNQREFIGPAIESVLAQDHPELEVLVCDDGSTDGSHELLREWATRDERIRLDLGDRNLGISANHNRGLNMCRGELITFLDGDDLMLPGKLTAQVRLLEAMPDAAGCVTDAEVFDSETGATLGLFSRRHYGRRGLRRGGVELLFDPTYLTLPSTILFRSRCCPEHGFDTRLRYANDWWFFIEVFRHGSWAVLDEVFVRYRRHAGNITASDHAERSGFEDGMLVMALVEANYPQLAGMVGSTRAALLYGEARRRVRDGDRAGAMRFVRAGMRAGGVLGNARLARQLAAATLGPARS